MNGVEHTFQFLLYILFFKYVADYDDVYDYI